MKTKAFFLCTLAIAALAALSVAVYTRTRPARPEPQSPSADAGLVANPSPSEPAPEPAAPEAAPPLRRRSPDASHGPVGSMSVEESAPITNKLERLAQVRESFRALAAGDVTGALRAASQLTDDTERETALLTLVTAWTHGELSPARQRAQWVAALGLEAGLGMELLKSPELAVLWASELTEGTARSAFLQRIAFTLAGSDPAAGLALGAQVPENERRMFSDALYAGWAANDTTAALQWVDRLSDPTERDAALQAVRSVAPVGIGAEVRMEDSGPIINRLIPGTPAELSGQLHPGDRIVALAQGDNSFVDARGLPLADVVQMIRGAPGTPLQLQVLAADAPADSLPRTISLVRDQIKFKR